MAARLSKLTRENLERMAAGLPMKQRRGRLGLWVPGDPLPPLQDIHPARYRSEHVECTSMLALGTGKRWQREIIHIANEGSASKARGGKLKAEGLRAGVLDYFLPMPRFHAHGLWLEMKASDGTISDDQDKFLVAQIEEGYAGCVAFGADAAVDAINRYLKFGWAR